MSSTTPTQADLKAGFGRTLIVGAVAGVIGSLVMAMFAMIAAATYQHALQYLPLHNGTQLKNQPELRGRIVQCLLTTLRGESLHNCDKLAQLLR